MFPARPLHSDAGLPARPPILAQLPTKVRGRWAAPLAALLLPAAVCAAGLPYAVRVSAPAPFDALLEKNLDLERFRGNEQIDLEQLQRLVRAAPAQIRTLVATAGYYSPDVSVRLDSGGAEPVVRIEVAPGEAVLVGSVDLELDGFAPAPGGAPFDAAALKSSWSLKPGQVFRQADWELAKRNLLRQATQTRYPRAQLSESQAAVDPERHRAALRVVLDSGPALRFGALRIEGLRRYPESVVRNLNEIAPGDFYSEAALQAYQSRLQDTGYFSNVEVSADWSALPEPLTGADGQPAATPGQGQTDLPLLVRVTENQRRHVSVGLGYSTDTGNRAQLSYDDLQVFGLRFKSALTLETKQQTAHADFFFPTAPQGDKDSVGASFTHSNIAGEMTDTGLVAAKRSWGTPRIERSLTLEFLHEKLTVAGLGMSESKSLPLTYSVTWRKLDSLLFPTSGHLIAAQLGVAPLPILTDERFVRAGLRGVWYRPLGKRDTLILRGEAGALLSKERDGVPSTYLFRAGGDQSVRGYAYQELGVHAGTAVVGGRYLATASAEAQHWFTPVWGGAAFYDAGNAGDSIAALSPKSGYGLGVRYKSAVGPINVDAAYGRADQQVRLHFSLGFTF